MGRNIFEPVQVWLVNPDERGILANAGDRMPLGLLSIAAQLESCKVIDLNHISELEFDGMLKYSGPDIVAISALTTPIYRRASDLLDKVRRNSDAITVVGGYHATVRPEDFTSRAERVVQGEGELFLPMMESNRQPKRIISPPKPDIEALNPPARDKLNPKKYFLRMNGKWASTMLTSRGCPNHCTFCGNMNHRVRFHTDEYVGRDLDTIASQGYKAVYVLDDVFTLKKDRAVRIGRMMKDRNLKFRCTTRANYMDGGLARRLAEEGCEMVSMGVESGNQEILDRCGKNQTLGQIENAVKYCADAGMKVKGFFIMGLPGETYSTANDTLNFSFRLRNLGMTEADFYPLVPYPGTELYDNPEKFGLKINSREYGHYWQANEEGHLPVCETNGLSARAIKNMVDYGMMKWK